MGKGSLTAGLVALLASLVPLTGPVLSVPACAVSALCAWGALRQRKDRRTSVAGLVLSGLSLVVAFLLMPLWAQR